LKWGFGAGLLLTIFNIVFFLLTKDIGAIFLITAIYCMIVISIPPFVAYIAAISTVNDMQPDQFDLLHMTSISNAHLIQGYILSTLYRCRSFFAVLIGTVPFAIIWGIYLSVYEVFVYCLRFSRTPDTCQPPSPMLVPLALIAFTVLVISIIGVCILSVSLGVLFAALSKSRLMSGMAAVIVALAASGSLTIIPMNHDVLNMLLASLFYVPFPYLLSLSTITIAQPLARKRF
jgi:hypothetical protein